MKNALTVTELTGVIKRLLESGFDVLWVTGEISNLRRPASGHVYFTLKDE
ncbi:MAG: exodeoxyribonuclease VII large subunit, partial [Thermodesulfobacteriota bacterium]|nr:exodeoxyribonuclease VII large subunit [Thermodesulfobacteriota bacterium]